MFGTWSKRGLVLVRKEASRLSHVLASQNVTKTWPCLGLWSMPLITFGSRTEAVRSRPSLSLNTAASELLLEVREKDGSVLHLLHPLGGRRQERLRKALEAKRSQEEAKK
ncbi:hypothetical protein PIB30_091632 [Stylosanthes scabra]|uniref:Uncharacterized protein n=1 Tax=Stylosanthes scabra TaxID=79078 RepID=A0ABU6SVJ9_9FABA|nr:hypothetical protein [Stylosanthes scabra]